MRIVRLRKLVGLTIALGVLAGVAPAAAGAAVTFNVNTTKDANLFNPTSDTCVAAVEGKHKCTLRAAIQADANLSAGTSATINVPAGHYKLIVQNPSSAATYLDVINPGSLDIAGAGAPSTIVDADFNDRAFVIENGGVAISGMTIENGRPGGLGQVQSCPVTQAVEDGGGILQREGTLTLKDDVVMGNMTPGLGGGIDNNGPGALTILSTTVSHNTSCQGGSGQPAGGGVNTFDGGPLTIRRSTISDNSAAPSGLGGGVAETESRGTTKIYDTTISGNMAFDGGGVDADAGGTFLLFGDLLTRNQASNFGGAFNNDDGDTDTFINTTIAGNSASSGGGGIEVGGLFQGEGFIPADTIEFSTIDGNSSDSGPANIDNGAGEGFGGAFIDDSIVIRGHGGNCATGSVTSRGHNLFDDTSDQGAQCGAGLQDVVTSSPKVDSVADNGGPTKTEALRGGSPALDAASSSRCGPETKNTSGDSVDQREFVPRPQGVRCDIGAFEATPNLGITATAKHNSIFVGQQDTVTDVINNSGPPSALNSTFTDPGAGYRIDSVSSSQGTCQHTSSTVTCNLGTVPSGGKVTITIVLTGLTAGHISLDSQTATSGLDRDLRNNHAAVGIKVKAVPPPPPPPPPKPKPSIGLAKLGPACYLSHSTIRIRTTARAVAGIRSVTLKLAGQTIRSYHSVPVAPDRKTITARVQASALHAGRPYPVTATVVDLLGRSAHAHGSLIVCKPPRRGHGFTG
jgi:Domain of unknown function DUF11